MREQMTYGDLIAQSTGKSGRYRPTGASMSILPAS